MRHPLTPRARTLRRTSTIPERRLWQRLRNRRLAGLKFRRQHVVFPYIIDFYCAALRLAIEVDGESHADRAAPDARRTAALRRRVIRFLNDDILHHLDAVCAAIAREAVSPRPATRGEGAERSEGG